VIRMKSVGRVVCVLLLGSSAYCGGTVSNPPARTAAEGGQPYDDGGFGQAGDADSSASVACPASEPTEGESCAGPVPPQCWYGDSPRPECRDVWVCSSSQWHATRQGCTPLPSGFCPASQPSSGMSCTVSDPSENAANCAYGSGTLCSCQCNTYSGRCSAGVPTIFGCHSLPTTTGCPPTVPNLGFTCGVQGTQCVYGNPCVGGIATLCRSGLWSIDSEYICYD
jgi:hypothetical protein